MNSRTLRSRILKIVGITMLVLAMLVTLVAGCVHFCTESFHEKSLGTIDTSSTQSVLRTTFTCPSSTRLHPVDIVGFTLSFADGKGLERRFSSTPDWPLVLGIVVIDETRQEVLTRGQLGRLQMVFSNWRGTNTCVILHMPPEMPKCLVPGKSYRATVTVVHQASDLGRGELCLNWTTSR